MMQLIEKGNELNKENDNSQDDLHTCDKCNSKVMHLYQDNLCRNCLNESFKQLVKVINAVRN